LFKDSPCSRLGLNDFERLKLIGVGGVGHVYLVRLKGTHQLYAMKSCRKADMEKQNKVRVGVGFGFGIGIGFVSFFRFVCVFVLYFLFFCVCFFFSLPVFDRVLTRCRSSVR
jgi:hypothetical protein